MANVATRIEPESAAVDVLQDRVLRVYVALMQQRASWASHLILLPGSGEIETALSFAGVIAGALVLAIDANADRQRRALRIGAFNFVVNTADEALRVLKNEARRGTPISVGLEAFPAVELPRLVNRGLRPSLIAWAGGQEIDNKEPGPEALVQALTDFTHMRCTIWRPHLDEIESTRPRPGYELYRFVLPHAGARQRFDEAALSIMPAEDELRRRWIETASRVLPRAQSVSRSLYLLPIEAVRLQNLNLSLQ